MILSHAILACESRFSCLSAKDVYLLRLSSGKHGSGSLRESFLSLFDGGRHEVWSIAELGHLDSCLLTPFNTLYTLAVDIYTLPLAQPTLYSLHAGNFALRRFAIKGMVIFALQILYLSVVDKLSILQQLIYLIKQVEQTFFFVQRTLLCRIFIFTYVD
jgi:hypothetical protein